MNEYLAEKRRYARPKFRLEVTYDETTGDPVSAYLRIREAPVSKTEEIKEGIAFVDLERTVSWSGSNLWRRARSMCSTASRRMSRNRFVSSCAQACAKRWYVRKGK